MKTLQEAIRKLLDTRKPGDFHTKPVDLVKGISAQPAPGPEWNCEQCRDTGRIRKDVPLEHPDFSKPFQCEACLEQRSEGRLERQRQRIREDLDPELADARFERMESHPYLEGQSLERYNAVKGGVQHWNREGHKERPWLVMLGKSGWGKTHLAYCAINERLDDPSIGPVGELIVVPDLLETLKEGIQDDSMENRLRGYARAPFLVLDDLGTEHNTEWAKVQLFRILDRRYKERLPTIITSNRSLNYLEERVKDRVMSRLISKVFDHDFKSFRTGE